MLLYRPRNPSPDPNPGWRQEDISLPKRQGCEVDSTVSGSECQPGQFEFENDSTLNLELYLKFNLILNLNLNCEFEFVTRSVWELRSSVSKLLEHLKLVSGAFKSMVLGAFEPPNFGGWFFWSLL